MTEKSLTAFTYPVLQFKEWSMLLVSWRGLIKSNLWLPSLCVRRLERVTVLHYLLSQPGALPEIFDLAFARNACVSCFLNVELNGSCPSVEPAVSRWGDSESRVGHMESQKLGLGEKHLLFKNILNNRFPMKGRQGLTSLCVTLIVVPCSEVPLLVFIFLKQAKLLLTRELLS